jgi:hypothetical protein
MHPWLQLPSKINITTVLIALSLSVNFLLFGFAIFLYRDAHFLKNELSKIQIPPPTPSSNNYKQSIINQEWTSPSGSKYLRYEHSPAYDDYHLMLFNGNSETNIGRSNEPLGDLRVSWSPNENYVLVANSSDLNRIFCISTFDTQCNATMVFMSYQGLALAYWADATTAYLRYNAQGQDIISKLEFKSDSVYPHETILYKEPWNAFFAYEPVSVSPNGRYLVLEFAYESLPTVSILDRKTGQIKTVIKDGGYFVVDLDPQYSWNGTVLTFEAAFSKNQAWPEVMTDNYEINAELVRSHSIDVSSLK